MNNDCRTLWNNSDFLLFTTGIRQIFKHEDRIVNYSYIAPNAMCDLGVCYFLADELSEAKKYLHSARADYTGKMLEGYGSYASFESIEWQNEL